MLEVLFPLFGIPFLVGLAACFAVAINSTAKSAAKRDRAAAEAVRRQQAREEARAAASATRTRQRRETVSDPGRQAPGAAQRRRTVSKPGEIACMLAKKYTDNPGAVTGKAFTLTEKLDGVRCIARVNGSDVEFYTRSGNRIDGLDEIAAELAAQNVSAMLDGELLIAGRGALPSKEEYKKTCVIVRSDGRKTGLVYHVFDLLPLDVYDRRATSAPYSARRAALERLQTVSAVEIVQVLYSGTDAAQIEIQLQAQRAAHHEGVMINVNDAPYAYGRTETLLKYKVMQDVDLKIVAVNPGTGKNADKCGSVTVEYKGNTVRVGTGLTDALRRAIWADPAAYIGRVITVTYFEETEDAHGKKSLRFPVFKELREPGKTVSYN